MALMAQVPIVPVAVHGGRDALKRGSWLIRPVTIRISVGAPIETTGRRLDQRDELIVEVRHEIERLVASQS
jgi:1-acyl-sn-glycerol-3-phosphate acyltransferase